MFTVTGSPTQAFVDAVQARLTADATLLALVTTVTGSLSGKTRTAYPYVVFGHRHRTTDGGAMQLAGGHVSLQLDVWSSHKGASEAHAILSRITVLLERHPLTVSGFALVKGSLTCAFEDVTDEVDPDMPERSLYHGIQLWQADIDEAA